MSPPGLVCCQKKGGREKEKKKTKEGGLSPQEGDVRKKKRKKTKEGEKVAPQRQGSVCPQQRISFLVHEYLGSERPISVEVSAPTRLSLRGSHVRRKFWQRTTLRSKSSTLKGLLYAPIKQEQYHKRTTLRRRLKIPLRSIRSEEGPHYRLGAKRKESCRLTSNNHLLFTSWRSSGDFLLGLYCVA